MRFAALPREFATLQKGNREHNQDGEQQLEGVRGGGPRRAEEGGVAYGSGTATGSQRWHSRYRGNRRSDRLITRSDRLTAGLGLLLVVRQPAAAERLVRRLRHLAHQLAASSEEFGGPLVEEGYRLRQGVVGGRGGRFASTQHQQRAKRLCQVAHHAGDLLDELASRGRTSIAAAQQRTKRLGHRLRQGARQFAGPLDYVRDSLGKGLRRSRQVVSDASRRGANPGSRTRSSHRVG